MEASRNMEPCLFRQIDIMAYKFKRQIGIPLVVQLNAIEKKYQNVTNASCNKGAYLYCELNIRPSAASPTYRIRVKQYPGRSPAAWLLSPKLQMKDGNYPRHVYSLGPPPELCVFYPDGREWTNKQLIADTFIPWISTWLNAYEYWLITGEWHYAESPHGVRK